MWIIKFTKQAEKDKKLLKEHGLDKKAKKILNVMSVDPLINPPSYEKLVGNLDGYYSRRLNVKHRIVYRIYKDKNTIVIHSMWSHYQSL